MDRINLNKHIHNKSFATGAQTFVPYAEDRNDDDPMPRQHQQKMPGGGNAGTRWEHYVDSAKIAWGELTEHELLKTQGNIKKLSALVQERYAITFAEAQKQVEGFFDTHKF